MTEQEKTTWIIVRTVKETYEVEAYSRAEALKIVAVEGDPSIVTVIKETCKPLQSPKP